MGFSKRDAPNCFSCPYRRQCFFWSLDRDAQKEWKELRIANRFSTGDVIFYDGEKPNGAYVVCSGKTKVFKTSRTGQQLIMSLKGPGQLMGYRSLLAGENYSGSAEAMEVSTVSFIDQEAFFSFLKRHGTAMFQLLRKLAQDVRESQEKALDIVHKPAKARVSDALLRTMHLNGHKEQPVVSGVKRREIAEMAGLTVETTVRVLKELEDRGLIRREQKGIVILDQDKIRHLASLTS